MGELVFQLIRDVTVHPTVLMALMKSNVLVFNYLAIGILLVISNVLELTELECYPRIFKSNAIPSYFVLHLSNFIYQKPYNVLLIETRNFMILVFCSISVYLCSNDHLLFIIFWNVILSDNK